MLKYSKCSICGAINDDDSDVIYQDEFEEFQWVVIVFFFFFPVNSKNPYGYVNIEDGFKELVQLNISHKISNSSHHKVLLEN